MSLPNAYAPPSLNMLRSEGVAKGPCFSKSREATILLLTPDDRRESGDSSAKPTNESRRDDVDKAALHRLFETQPFDAHDIPQTPCGRLGFTITTLLRDSRRYRTNVQIHVTYLLLIDVDVLQHPQLFSENWQYFPSDRNYYIGFLVLSLRQNDYEEVCTYLIDFGVLSYECAGY